MINSKKLLGFALLSATMILASCGGNGNSGQSSGAQSDPASGGGESSAVCPVVEGKTAIYFKVAEDSVELPSWCSYFLTGVWNGWATSADGAIEMQKLEGTDDIFYGYIDGYDDSAYAADRGYQLTMGYNASSGLGADSLGINWSYKALSNASWPGVEHPTFNAPENGEIHLLANYKTGEVEDTFKWSAALPEPIVLHNYTVKFTVSADVAVGLTGDVKGLAYKGTTNGWGYTELTESEGVYSFTVPEIIANSTYEMCVAPVTAAKVLDDKYNLTGTGTKNDDSVDAEDGKFHLGNLTFTPLALDGDDAVLDWGELQIPEIANGTVDEVYAFPTATPLGHDITIRLSDKEDGTGFSGEHLAVAGSWNGWSYKEENYMNAEADGSYTYVIPADQCFIGTKLEWGIISNSSWAGKLVQDNGDGELENMAVTPEANKIVYDVVADLSKIGVEDAAAISIDYHEQFINGIKIIVNDDGDDGIGDDLTLAVAGSWNGWAHKEENYMTPNADRSVWTYEIADDTVFVGEKLEFGIISNSNWAGKLSAEGGANFSFVVREGETQEVEIIGDLALNGVSDSIGTLVYTA